MPPRVVFQWSCSSLQQAKLRAFIQFIFFIASLAPHHSGIVFQCYLQGGLNVYSRVLAGVWHQNGTLLPTLPPTCSHTITHLCTYQGRRCSVTHSRGLSTTAPPPHPTPPPPAIPLPAWASTVWWAETIVFLLRPSSVLDVIIR